MDRVSLFRGVVIITKITPRENLTDEIFYQQKIPDLLYHAANISKMVSMLGIILSQTEVSSIRLGK